MCRWPLHYRYPPHQTAPPSADTRPAVTTNGGTRAFQLCSLSTARAVLWAQCKAKPKQAAVQLSTLWQCVQGCGARLLALYPCSSSIAANQQQSSRGAAAAAEHSSSGRACKAKVDSRYSDTGSSIQAYICCGLLQCQLCSLSGVHRVVQPAGLAPGPLIRQAALVAPCMS